MQITAENFFNKFLDCLKKHHSEAISSYSNSKEWTKFLKEKIRFILENEFNLKFNNEYFRVDIIGWSGSGKENKSNVLNKEHDVYEYYWNLDIAVEYENDSKLWLDEVIKLCHIKCGLKVVIGYAHFKKRNDDIKKLELASANIKNLKYAKLTKDENFLIILGNSGKDKYESLDDIGFKAYKFDKEKFIPLSN